MDHLEIKEHKAEPSPEEQDFISNYSVTAAHVVHTWPGDFSISNKLEYAFANRTYPLVLWLYRNSDISAAIADYLSQIHFKKVLVVNANSSPFAYKSSINADQFLESSFIVKHSLEDIDALTDEEADEYRRQLHILQKSLDDFFA